MATPDLESNGAGRKGDDPEKSAESREATKLPRPRRPAAAARRATTHEPQNAERRTSEVVNFIRPAKTQDRLGPIATATVTAAPDHSAAKMEKDADTPNSLRPGLDSESVPDHFRKRYVQDGRTWLMPSGEVAIVDHGLRLSTKTENTTIIQDMVATAKERKWNEIVIGGTKAFEKEAWRVAKLAGLEVIGYKPSRAEQALLIQALTRRQEPTAQPERPAAKTEESTKAPAEESSLTTGRLREHRAAHRFHDPEEPMSYFVRISPGRGKEDIEIWGNDLGRAVRQSLTDVQVGDEIGVRAIRREDVPGQAASPASDTDPYRWIVEQRRFFNDRAVLAKVFADADIRPSDGYRRHPELKGSYLELQAKKLRFEQSVKNPDEQAKFLARVREGMSAAMERGEPLTPVRMRDRVAAKESEARAQSIPDPEHLFTR